MALFSDHDYTLPLHLRQMIADQQHSPQRNFHAVYDEAFLDWFEDFDPITYREYLQGD